MTPDLRFFHGLNPGAGWLFAVAIGFRERSRAVRRAESTFDRSPGHGYGQAVPYHRLRLRATYELVLLGIHAHAVADILCS